MAPLRTSRQTRNQDHAAAKSRTGIVDLDPTDGLPVTKWSQISVRVNQETDFTAINTPNANITDWNVQFNTSQYPWSEPERPTFIKDLPSWNQEMLRRARIGSTNVKLSVWDRKTNCWVSAAEAEKKSTSSKQQDQKNQESNNQDGHSHDSPKSEHESEDENDKSEDEDMPDDENPLFKAASAPNKRRKTGAARHLEPRIFEVKKWIQVPTAVAEKVSEPKFLADRRPGMPALYNPVYQNTIFGSYLSSNQPSMGTNYDLGDGGGLGYASGMLGSGGQTEPVAPPTPVRKNMPPRRKKKKIGGPGRKKGNSASNGLDGANSQTLGVQQTGVDGSSSVAAGDQLGLGDGTDPNSVVGSDARDVIMGEAGEHDEDDESSETGSEAEGSEEGEVDEAETNTVNKAELTGDMVQAATENAPESSVSHETALLSTTLQEPIPVLQEDSQSQIQPENLVSTATAIPEPLTNSLGASEISNISGQPITDEAVNAITLPEAVIPPQGSEIPQLPLAPQTTEQVPAAPEEVVITSAPISGVDEIAPPMVMEEQIDASSAVPISDPIPPAPLLVANPEPADDSIQAQPAAIVEATEEPPAPEIPVEPVAAPTEQNQPAVMLEAPVVEPATVKGEEVEGGDRQPPTTVDNHVEGSDLLGGLDAAIDKDMSGS